MSCVIEFSVVPWKHKVPKLMSFNYKALSMQLFSIYNDSSTFALKTVLLPILFLSVWKEGSSSKDMRRKKKNLSGKQVHCVHCHYVCPNKVFFKHIELVGIGRVRRVAKYVIVPNSWYELFVNKM